MLLQATKYIVPIYLVEISRTITIKAYPFKHAKYCTVNETIRSRLTMNLKRGTLRLQNTVSPNSWVVQHALTAQFLTATEVF